MTNTFFKEIDSLHAELEKMDKSARLGWLTGAKMHLNQLANQYAQYIYLRGGFSNNEERTYARKLLEMIQEVDVEGAKLVNDLVNDAFKEIAKSSMR